MTLDLLLERAILTGEPVLSEWLNSHMATMQADRDRVLAAISQNSPGRRFLDLAKVALSMNTESSDASAFLLISSLYRTFSTSLHQRLGLAPELNKNLAEVLANSAATASAKHGRLREALAAADLFTSAFGLRSQSLEEWAIRALVQDLRILDAVERYRHIERSLELDLLVDSWWPWLDPAQHFAPQQLERVPDQDRIDGIARLKALEWISGQGDAIRSERDQSTSLDLDEKTRREKYWRDLERILSSLSERAQRNDLTGMHLAYQRALLDVKAVVHELRGEAAASESAAAYQSDRAAVVVSDPQATNEDIAEGRYFASLAKDWFERHDQLASVASAAWRQGLLCERCSRPAEALASFKRVLEILVMAASGMPSAEEHAHLIRNYPRLYQRIVRLAVATGDLDLAFWAAEANRGLLTAKDAIPATWPYPDHRDHEWHCFTTFVDDDGAISFLRTGAGKIYCSVLDASRSELDDWIRRSVPLQRNTSRLRENGFSGQSLSRLLSPISIALREGQVAEGDHIAIALDYPVHNLSIQSLDIDGCLAIERFSFSRVGSFADGVRLAGHAGGRPLSAAVVVIPAIDNDLDEHKRAALRVQIPEVSIDFVGPDKAAGRSLVMELLGSHGIVHLQAHGYFPQSAIDQTVDAFQRAGVLVGRDHHLPDRSMPEDYLLSPSDILGGRIVSEHVSLASCVSGLGRPGKGGDLLGVELALRRAGAVSVSASHWDVTLHDSAEFYSAFYRHWLGSSMSRAAAIRKATLDLLSKAGDDEMERAKACAFSLYGVWN